MPVFGHHLTLAYFAVAPLYWLGGGPQLLDLLQTAALGAVGRADLPVRPRPPRQRRGRPWPSAWRGCSTRPCSGCAGRPGTPRRWPSRSSSPPTCWPPAGSGGGTGSPSSPPSSWKEDIAIAVAILGIVFAVRGRAPDRSGDAGPRRGLVPRRLRGRHAALQRGHEPGRDLLRRARQLPRRPRPHDADRSDPRDRPPARQRRPRLRPRPAGAVRVPARCWRRRCSPSPRRSSSPTSSPTPTSSTTSASTTRRSSWRCSPWRRSKAWPGCGWPGCAGSASASSPRRRWRRRSPGASRRSAPTTGSATGRSRATPARTCSTTPSPASRTTPRWRRRTTSSRTSATATRSTRSPTRGSRPTGASPAWRPTTPTATTCRRRSSGSSSTAPPTTPGSREELLLDELLDQRRVRGRLRPRGHRRRPPGGAAGAAGTLIWARWVSISRLAAPRWPAETVRAQIDEVASGGCQSGGRRSVANAARTPLTKRPLLSVEKRLASSTASSMTTATGTSARSASS